LEEGTKPSREIQERAVGESGCRRYFTTQADLKLLKVLCVFKNRRKKGGAAQIAHGPPFNSTAKEADIAWDALRRWLRRHAAVKPGGSPQEAAHKFQRRLVNMGGSACALNAICVRHRGFEIVYETTEPTRKTTAGQPLTLAFATESAC